MRRFKLLSRGLQVDTRRRLSIVFWMSTIGPRLSLVSKKRATESTSQDGLGMLRRGLKRRASTLPDLDVEYVSAALTILRTALEVKNYYVERF